MCNGKILPSWCAFFLISDRFKTQEMCDEAVTYSPRMLRHEPDHFRTLGMCIKAVKKNPQRLQDVPDQFKTQKMCEKALKKSHGCWKVSLISIRRRRCVLRPLKKVRTP